MDKKTQQKIHGNMRTCDIDHAKQMKQEPVSELNLLKLIDLSRGLDDEEKKRLQTIIEIITKEDVKFDGGGSLYSAKHRTKLMLAWTNSNYMNLGFNLMKAGH